MISITFLYLPIPHDTALCLIRKAGDGLIVQIDQVKMNKLSELEQDRVLAHEMRHLMMMEKMQN